MVRVPVQVAADAPTVAETPLQPPLRPYQVPEVSLVDRHIDEVRPLDVIVIGGGLAGITLGALLPAKVPGINLTILEKNHDFGGAWLENVYPGVRCDIPSHVYQSTFAPKTDWTDDFSYGAEIRDYWQDLARAHGVYELAKFNQQVECLSWDAGRGKWTVTATDLSRENQQHREGECDGTPKLVHSADFVILAVGRFNAWQLPQYPGMDEYQGVLRHTSNWDPTFDPTGKRVAVIGNGASGIQCVPGLQKVVSHLDHYARNGTWISSSLGGDDRPAGAKPIDEGVIASFEDPETYLAFRKAKEDKYWRRFKSMLRNDDKIALAAEYTSVMKQRLAKKPELLEQILPPFPPECRRLTPGPGYLEALAEDNVEFIRTPISRFTATGIETIDGRHRPVDAVFCATGSNIDMVHQFPIYAHGQDLRQLWSKDGKYGFPYTYLGLSTPGFPNLFFAQGPHGSGQSGTVTHSTETQATYLAQLLRKASREGIKSVVASHRAADDFVAYSDAFFATTVLTDNCSSWYNGGRPGARIHGLWPGSAAQMTIIRRHPRWEDYNYEYLHQGGNSLAWYFGSGSTRFETDPDTDMTPYLRLPSQTDLRTLHEES